MGNYSFFESNEVKSYHDNGQLKERKCYRNGKLEGESEFWFNNGRIYTRGFYRDGKQEGCRKYWCTDGELWRREFYQDGMLDGRCEVWSSGRLAMWKFYKYGKANGERKSWYENGRLWEYEYYRDDEIMDDEFSAKKKFPILVIKRKFRILHLRPTINSYIISAHLKPIKSELNERYRVMIKDHGHQLPNPPYLKGIHGNSPHRKHSRDSCV